jgi:hypothetical protein
VLIASGHFAPVSRPTSLARPVDPVALTWRNGGAGRGPYGGPLCGEVAYDLSQVCGVFSKTLCGDAGTALKLQRTLPAERLQIVALDQREGDGVAAAPQGQLALKR